MTMGPTLADPLALAASPEATMDVYVLRTRFLSEPCLWSWEIVHGGADPVIVQSSWENDWRAFESRDEAQRAGAAALADLLAA
jgi:hypothetical protein